MPYHLAGPLPDLPQVQIPGTIQKGATILYSITDKGVPCSKLLRILLLANAAGLADAPPLPPPRSLRSGLTDLDLASTGTSSLHNIADNPGSVGCLEINFTKLTVLYKMTTSLLDCEPPAGISINTRAPTIELQLYP
eukprot:scaffold646643_cov23-Prasinocladus_malaysianus.AAC.1